MHKKKDKKTGQESWVEPRAEKVYNTFQALQEEERRAQAESVESTGSTRPPQRTEDELLLEAGGGPYKGRAYAIGPLPSRPRSVYAASTSSSVSQQQYDEMRDKVAQLTEELQQVEHRVTEQVTQQVEQRVTQRFEAMMSALQSQMQELSDTRKTQKENPPESDNEN